MPIYCKGTICKNCIVFYGHSWKNFDEESKEDLCSITFPIRYKKRQLICMEANPVQNIYIVKKGLVKTYKSLPGGKQQILSIIKKEDILNIHCLFEDFGHHSSETLVDSELCAIDKNLLENLLKRKPKTGIIFLEIMKKKLVRSYQKIMELGQKNARSRIASFILDLSENLFDEQRHDFSLPLSRVEFAEVVGLCEETAIRILQDFKRESLINIDKNSISLLNPARLQKISEK
jgi:cAMP-binding proteins - catabolite gene activator and regulatory subunit of cAMP-dependent protein kinases